MKRLALVLALVAGTVPAFAQDQQPAPAPAPRPVHRAAAPRPAVHHAAAAAAPATTATAPAGKLTAAAAQKNPVAVLQAFSVSDLQAALADAQAQTPPDTTAANCYQALITVIQNPVANPLPAGPGLFQLLQKARDAKNWISQLQANNGPLSAVNAGCAPLILDAQNTLIQLGILSGAVVGGGMLGIPPILPLGQNDGPPNFLAYQQARDRWATAAAADELGTAPK
jgi:hypothetical protein